MGSNNDNPMYKTYYSTKGKIVSFRDVTFIEQVQINAPSSMVLTISMKGVRVKIILKRIR